MHSCTNETMTSSNPTTTFLLAAPEDEHVLNPLHCFVRRNVEVFAATTADLAAPAPGRRVPVVLGQVGVRCVHCAALPVRDRVKRSVCYPPNVAGIYHAVSNMKFDHFGACRGLDAAARAEFQELRASCGRRGGGKKPKLPPKAPRGRTSASTTSSSTAQYYHDSALNLGLVDGTDGIRFLPDEAAKIRAAAAMVIHAQSPHAAARPLLPPMALPAQVPLPNGMSTPLPPLGNVGASAASFAVTPDQRSICHATTLGSIAQVRPAVPIGLSALMMAAAERAAEHAAQVPTTATSTKQAV